VSSWATRGICLLQFAFLLLPSTRLYAQGEADPRTAQPERPTVATHAWSVAPGYAELEAGIERDWSPDGTHAFSTPVELKIGLAHRMQLGLLGSLVGPPGQALGPGDLTIALKYRLAEGLPLLGAFAVLPSVKFPTADRLHGTGTTDASLLLISSHELGPVSLDVNLGYTRRSGDGSRAPKNASVWTAAIGAPIRGPLGLAAELFGFPGTSGPAGAKGSVALLGGPTLVLHPWWTLDAGGILRLRGPQADAFYAGLVYNLGRL